MTLQVVELFAGAGGFATGIEQAGIKVSWAGNHYPPAVEAYERNHGLKPVCADLFLQRWNTLPKGVWGMAASPSCTGFTDARGVDKPGHDSARSTAWCVVQCAEFNRVPVLVVENVAEFLEWELWPAWLSALQALGYVFDERLVELMRYGPKPTHPDGKRMKRSELPRRYVDLLTQAHEACLIDAADCGAPQERERVFIIGVHRAHRRVAIDLKQPRLPHVSVSTIIDFSAGKWSPIETERRAPATLARVAAGRKTFGDRFVFPFYKSGSGLTGRSLDRPLGTVTVIDRWAVVDGDRLRMFTVPEYKAVMTFPQDYWLPPTKREAVHLLGNAVCPVVGRYVWTTVLEAAA